MFNLLSNQIPNLLKQLPENKELAGSVVCAVWSEVVGEALAQRTRPIKLHGATLIVAVPSLVWRRELKPVQGEILRKLEQRLGPGLVRQLEFKCDEAFDESAPARHAPTPSVSTAGLNMPMEEIKDEDLRQQLVKAASSYLAHQQSGARKRAATGG